MKKIDYLILWVLAIGLWLLIMPLRGYNFLWAITAHSIAFAILTWWALKKYESKAGFWPPLIPMLAPWLLELGMRCFIKDSLFSLPITIMPIWAVVTVALFYRYRKVWLLVACLAIFLYGTTRGREQWTEWVLYGNCPVSTVNLADCEVSDSNHTFRLSDVDAEYIVLDVWSSRCGVCIKQMPEIQALYDEYKDSEKIKVVSLFTCLLKGETISEGYRILNRKGYDFPIYAIEKDSPILTSCNIMAFPRLLILDKDRTVIFNGSLESAKRKLKDV